MALGARVAVAVVIAGAVPEVVEPVDVLEVLDVPDVPDVLDGPPPAFDPHATNKGAAATAALMAAAADHRRSANPWLVQWSAVLPG